MINRNQYHNIHGQGSDSDEVQRRWLLFEQEQAALAQQYLVASGGGSVPVPEPEPTPPPGYTLTMGVDAMNTNNFYVGINSTPDGPMNLIFDWGDGTVESFVHDPSTQLNYYHGYASVGTYTMTLEIDEPDYVAGIIIDAND